MNNLEIIAIDFDGTLCENKWPEIGKANHEVIDYIIDRKDQHGAKLILWTCRTKEALDNAVKWCNDRGIVFDAVNDNLPEIVVALGGDARKIFATEYIDDRASRKFRLPFNPSDKDQLKKEDEELGLSLACGNDPIGGLLSEYGKYVIKFAKNHNLSVSQAHGHPMCQARLDYFNRTGE